MNNRLVELGEEIEESKLNLIADYNNRANLVKDVEKIAKTVAYFAERLKSESTLSKERGSAIMFISENYPTIASSEIYREVIKSLRDKTESTQTGIRILKANIRSDNVYRQSFFGQKFSNENYPRRIEYPPMQWVLNIFYYDIVHVSFYWQ